MATFEKYCVGGNLPMLGRCCVPEPETDRRFVLLWGYRGCPMSVIGGPGNIVNPIGRMFRTYTEDETLNIPPTPAHNHFLRNQFSRWENVGHGNRAPTILSNIYDPPDPATFHALQQRDTGTCVTTVSANGLSTTTICGGGQRVLVRTVTGEYPSLNASWLEAWSQLEAFSMTGPEWLVGGHGFDGTILIKKEGDGEIKTFHPTTPEQPGVPKIFFGAEAFHHQYSRLRVDRTTTARTYNMFGPAFYLSKTRATFPREGELRCIVHYSEQITVDGEDVQPNTEIIEQCLPWTTRYLTLSLGPTFYPLAPNIKKSVTHFPQLTPPNRPTPPSCCNPAP